MADKEISFEAAFKKLEEIAAKLDDSSISLDESLKLFEEGVKLSTYCNSVLDKAWQKIDTLKNAEEEAND